MTKSDTLHQNQKVCVIIPSYNSAKTIERCLNSLHHQNTKVDFQIVMVDSSSDGTEQLVQQKFPSVKVIHFDQQCSCGKARNIGIENTNTDIILFIDSDCIAQTTWVENMSNALINQKADAVCGAFENGTPSDVIATAGFYLEFFRFLQSSGKSQQTNWLVGGNSGFHRSVLESVEYVNSSLGDDFLMSYQLRQKGKKLLFLSNSPITHLNKTGFQKVWNYQKLIGFAAARYRQVTSPKIMSIFNFFPWLCIFTPLLIIPWITFSVLMTKRMKEFSKFLLILPITIILLISWVLGFYQFIVQRPNN